MKEIKAEYEAYWHCPKCGGLTYQSDETPEWFDNGEVIDVVCGHEVDRGEYNVKQCCEKYTVDLRP